MLWFRKFIVNASEHPLKPHAETYSEFAFRLSTQFKRWAESEHAYVDVAKLRELILMEQFKTHLEPSMRGWLIDQKPQTLSELSRLADQYVAVHLPDHPGKGSQHPKGNQFFPKSGQGNFHRPNVTSQEVGNKPPVGPMSELMQIFLTEFGIGHIRSSLYHTQTNGACERFNGTLKKMLTSLTEKFLILGMMLYLGFYLLTGKSQ